jgi:rod shape-determining protein MreC
VAILANRVKIRNNLIELSKFTIFSIRKFFTLILILIACYLLYFSSPYVSRTLLEVTGRVLSAGSLVYQETIQISKRVYGRLSYFKNLEAENLRLKMELASLEAVKQQVAQEHLENVELKKILNVTQEIKYDFITAKVIGTALTPFSNSATIRAGEKDGVAVNDIVRGRDGLIGRVVEVSDNYSTVMLFSDHNSRIPVITENSKNRGILTRQGEHLRIIYLQENHNMQIGERVYTSGDGQIYPRGIAVATIKSLANDSAVVESIENIENTDFVVIYKTQIQDANAS